jgi:hypothetical protein
MKRIRHSWSPCAGLPLGLGLVFGVLLGASCNYKVESVFTCLTDEDCVAEGGEGGVCEPNNLCTFPDAECPTGKRWHDRAAELAGKCYDPADIADTTSAGTASGSGSGSSSESGSSSTGPDTTTLPADDSGSSSGTPPPMTDSGSSSGGMPGMCDGLFGAAPGYMLCEETDTTCSFTATLAMTSCDAMCMMFGATCTATFTNTAPDCASIDVETTCDDATANDQICVCAKP